MNSTNFLTANSKAKLARARSNGVVHQISKENQLSVEIDRPATKKTEELSFRIESNGIVPQAPQQSQFFVPIEKPASKKTEESSSKIEQFRIAGSSLFKSMRQLAFEALETASFCYIVVQLSMLEFGGGSHGRLTDDQSLAPPPPAFEQVLPKESPLLFTHHVQIQES